jgi:PAS domain S-box-containing protein
MIFTFTLQNLLSLFLFGIALFYAVVTWSRRPVPGAIAFSLFLFAISGWILLRVLGMAVQTLEHKYIFALLMYIFVSVAIISWFIFALDYSGNKIWRNKIVLIVLGAFSAAGFLLEVTYPWHGLDWLNVFKMQVGVNSVLLFNRNLISLILQVFMVSVVLIGWIALIRYAAQGKGVLKKQIGGLLAGTLFAATAGVLVFTGVTRTLSLDIIPPALFIAASLYASSLFRYHFMDMVPVAKTLLMDVIPYGVVVLDRNIIISDFNQAFLEIIKMTRQDIAGAALWMVWPRLEKSLRSLPWDNSLDVLHNNGRHYEVSQVKLTDKYGGYLGRMVIIRDVSEREKIERSIRESEARYAQLVEQSNEGVTIVQDGKIKFGNRKVREFSGLSASELVDKNVLDLVAASDREIVEERHHSRVRGETEASMYEMKVLVSGGHEKEVSISIGAIEYEGKPAFIVTMRDISESKQFQKKLEKLYEQEKKLRASLQEEIENRSKYTRALGHELNTPLTSILASGELLEDEIEDKKLMTLVKNLRMASNDLKKRIEELIELARGETGLLKINALPLEIGELLREVGGEMEPLIRSKGLNIKIEMGEVPVVLGDRSRLKQVVLNLIGNALQYTRRGEIEIGAEVKGEDVEVRVKDSGREVDEDKLDEMFDPYHRKHSGDQKPSGLGVGLALSKMIVESHGGKINMERLPERGNLFTFTVPLYSKNKMLSELINE